MRKVALIEEQRRDREKEEILKSILDTMNAKRGQADLTKSEFAHKAGIHENTWAKWNKLGLTSRDYQVPMISIGPLRLGKTGIRALSEIGAHGFAHTYHQLLEAQHGKH